MNKAIISTKYNEREKDRGNQTLLYTYKKEKATRNQQKKKNASALICCEAKQP